MTDPGGNQKDGFSCSDGNNVIQCCPRNSNSEISQEVSARIVVLCFNELIAGDIEVAGGTRCNDASLILREIVISLSSRFNH